MFTLIQYVLLTFAIEPGTPTAPGAAGNDPTTGESTGTPAAPSYPGASDSDCSDHKIFNLLPCVDSGEGSVWNLLTIIVNFLAVGVGVAVLVGIIWGAFLYSSAGGSAEQAKKGVGYIRNAVIALIAFVCMYAIINFVIPGGLL